MAEFETRRDPGVTHADHRGHLPGETHRDAAAPPPLAGPAPALLRLPGPLAERFAVVGELPVQGAESDLLLVRDAQGVDYVVKIYRRGYGADREVWRKLPELASPHVVRIFETGRADDRDFEVIEYAPAGNLRALIPATGLEPGRAAEMAAQLAAGVDLLHRAGIVHRDLKPENVLVASQDPLRLVITDFGLSKVIEQSMVFASSSRTLAYAAPESLSGQVSPARDWWSLGMIVRELATGRQPFAGMSETAVVDHLATRPIGNDDIADPRLRLLCQGLLTRDPRRRWAAAEVNAWRGGASPPVAVEPAAPPAGGATRPVPAGGDGPGLPFAGRRYTDRTELAAALVDNWDEAARFFFGRGESGEAWRTLRDWLARVDEADAGGGGSVADGGAGRIELIDSHLTGPRPPDVKLLYLVRWLDPSLPPHYLGRRVTADDLPGLAALANEAPHPDHRTACLIGRGLWDHDLLPVLAGFAGGDDLAAADSRWRGQVAAWNELAGWLRDRLPQPAASRLPDAGAPGRDEPPVVLLTLLALAAKPVETGEMLARAAVRARDSVREPVPWFAWLADGAGDDPLRLLAVIRTAPDAALEAETYVRNRDAARQQAAERERHWADRERVRRAGRPAAVARAVAWMLPVLAVWVVGGALVGAGLSLERGGGAGDTLGLGVGGFVLLSVAAWSVQLGAEIVLAVRQGRDYLALGPWSAMVKTFGLAGRGLSGASRAMSGARRRRGESRGRGCLLAAVGLFVLFMATVFLPALLSISRALWLLIVVVVPVAHTIAAGVRQHRWRQTHERTKHDVLGQSPPAGRTA
ncbi:MAG TPA: serine/threonine-protein kinase [Streptosporangiaceae bacterium]|nr:serine/threonine-protein kinase [Streptosporangiaceae bacterium]